MFHIIAGSTEPGFKNGTLLESKFDHPSAIAIDSKYNLLIADSANGAIRYIDFQTDTVSTIVDKSSSPLIRCPISIALDNTRNIAYVTEAQATILRIDLDSKIVETFTKFYYAEPCGLCLSHDNQILYMCDREDNTIYQFKLNLPPVRLEWKVERLL